MTTETMSKAKSLTLVGIAYVVAIAVGAAWLVWGVHTGRLWLDTLVADVLATLVIFAFSRVYGNSSFYDAYWSVIPQCCCSIGGVSPGYSNCVAG